MRVALLAVAACSVGCLSEQPIVPGAPETVDRGLLGSWRCLMPGEASAAPLTITEADGRKLRGLFAGEDKGWIAYAVTFEGRRLLNVQAEGAEGKAWTLAQYTLFRPTVLHVEYPKYNSEMLKNVSTPTQRRDALRRSLKAKTLFDESFTCIRSDDPESPK
jgi:hypothetical protein